MSKPVNYKTKMCNNWKNGYCAFGSNCHFIHDEYDSELSNKPCRFYPNCKNGDTCKFSHIIKNSQSTSTTTLTTPFPSTKINPFSTTSTSTTVFPTSTTATTANCWTFPNPIIKNPFSVSEIPVSSSLPISFSSPLASLVTPVKYDNPFSSPTSFASPLTSFETQELQTPQTPKKPRKGPLFPIESWAETSEQLSDEDIEELINFYKNFDIMMSGYNNLRHKRLINTLKHAL